MRGAVRAGDAAAARAPRAHAPAPEFADAIDTLTRDIHDPVARLRALRESLSRYEPVDRAVTAVPSPRARRLLYRLLRLEWLRALSLAFLSRRRWWRALPAAAGLVAAAWLVGPGGAPSPGDAVAASASDAHPAPSNAAVAATPKPLAATPEARVADAADTGAAPASVWLVERDGEAEVYSNGLRIETRFATDNAPRRFRAFDREGRLQESVHDRPVGLLFHTSESDIWPMDAAYNESLRDSSHRLLRYVRRERLYNYLVDRFGRVFRIVHESQRAHHAGHSIWATDERVYLNLNNAFLGVCFESRWDGGHATPITAAQLDAGRRLTAYLRHRWELAADMCVTHGLTSVNPQKHLIGHHVDWARGFPFEAFGLPDHYRRPAPSVALFGFSYDDEFLKKMERPWEGVYAAEQALAGQARERGVSVDELRRERRALYDRWIAELARGESMQATVQRASGAVMAPPPRTRRAAPGNELNRGSGG